ncbi:hypothetical protein Cfor_09798, partial [Coptotermes formosanus]
RVVTAIVFWESKGVLHLDFLAGQKTINAQNSSTLLNEKVKPAIRSKRRMRQDSVCSSLHCRFNDGNSTGTGVVRTASSSVQPRLSSI